VLKQLHAKSLNQLLRDKLVSEAGAGVLDFQEEHSPAQLMSLFAYGDLLHWGKKRDVVAALEADEFAGIDRRSAFLQAAVVLAHVHMGFAELVRTALGRRPPT
jgi:hypothetical protein